MTINIGDRVVMDLDVSDYEIVDDLFYLPKVDLHGRKGKVDFLSVDESSGYKMALVIVNGHSFKWSIPVHALHRYPTSKASEILEMVSGV